MLFRIPFLHTCAGGSSLGETWRDADPRNGERYQLGPCLVAPELLAASADFSRPIHCKHPVGAQEPEPVGQSLDSGRRDLRERSVGCRSSSEESCLSGGESGKARPKGGGGRIRGLDILVRMTLRW